LIKDLDKNSLVLAKSTKLIFINNKNAIKNRKSTSVLEIVQIDYICNRLIPFFDKLNFRTKKYLDYLDFRRIAFFLLDGKHLSKNGKSLIDKLGDTMNNNRLSTNKKKTLFSNLNLNLELELLEKSEPLVINKPDGRTLLISKNIHIRNTLIIEATLPSFRPRAVGPGTESRFSPGPERAGAKASLKLKYFPTGVSCAKYFSVSSNTISRRLNDKKPLVIKQNKILAFSLKRIKVYTKNSCLF